jgi:hypothetical protein
VNTPSLAEERTKMLEDLVRKLSIENRQMRERLAGGVVSEVTREMLATRSSGTGTSSTRRRREERTHLPPTTTTSHTRGSESEHRPSLGAA